MPPSRKPRRRRYLEPIQKWHKERQSTLDPQRFADESLKLMQETGMKISIDDGSGWRHTTREDLVKMGRENGKLADEMDREDAMKKRRSFPIGTKRILLSPKAAARAMAMKLKRKFQRRK